MIGSVEFLLLYFQKWFHMFIPKRLELQYQSHAQGHTPSSPIAQQGGGNPETQTRRLLNHFDTSKVLFPKSLKDHRYICTTEFMQGFVLGGGASNNLSLLPLDLLGCMWDHNYSNFSGLVGRIPTTAHSKPLPSIQAFEYIVLTMTTILLLRLPYYYILSPQVKGQQP